MFRTPPKETAKKRNLPAPKKVTGRRKPLNSTGLASAEKGGNPFVESVSDSRLSKEENTILAQKLWGIREAFIALLLSKRETSHNKDFVVG